MTALAVENGSVGVFELHKMVVEDLTVILSLPDFTAAHALGLDGVSAFEPVDDVDVVDVLFGDVVTAKPDEIVPVAHLVFHFGLFGFTLVDPYAVVVPPGLGGGDVSDQILALEQFAI